MWVGFDSRVLLVYLIWVFVNSFLLDSFEEMQNGFLKQMDVYRKKMGLILLPLLMSGKLSKLNQRESWVYDIFYLSLDLIFKDSIF